MIKVKDTKRLKAFGFEETDNGYKKERHNEMRIVVSSEGFLTCWNIGYEVTDSWDLLDSWFADELFDLQAAGLLERVEDNGKEGKA